MLIFVWKIVYRFRIINWFFIMNYHYVCSHIIFTRETSTTDVTYKSMFDATFTKMAKQIITVFVRFVTSRTAMW